MRKNKVLTIWAAIVFAFLMIPLLIPDRVLLDEMVRERVRAKVFPQIIPDQP